jgi:heat shock protein HslJ
VARHVRALALLLLVATAAGCSPAGDDSANGGLAETSWTVIAINGGGTIPGSEPTMAFRPEGVVSGTGGCNQYSAVFHTDHDRISFGSLGSTRMRCEGAHATQETAFFDALGRATSWRLAGNGNLELSGADRIEGRPGVNVSPSPPASGDGLAGTAWDLVELGSTADLAHLVPTIQFTADGRVTGFSACNTFSGTYVTDGPRLSLGPLAATEIGCQRPASEIEAEYLAALQAVSTWAIEPDGRLLLDGGVPLRFSRH